ncbi:MAG: ROK family protein [Chloroflexota bacterium]
MNLLVDMGGTSTRFGWSGTSEMAPVATIPTPRTTEGIVRTIAEQVEHLATPDGRPVEGVAIAVPGLVNAEGYVRYAVHVPLTGIDLPRILGDLLGVAVVVVNDAKAQALGCAEPGESLTYIVVGTSVGGAHLDAGRFVEGANGHAGEIGHMPIPGSDEQCRCGRIGCLDTVAAGWKLEESLGVGWWSSGSTAEIARVLSRAGEGIGIAAAICSALLDPSRIMVTGHVCRYEEFRSAVGETFESRRLGECSLEMQGDTWQFAKRGLSLVFGDSTSERPTVSTSVECGNRGRKRTITRTRRHLRCTPGSRGPTEVRCCANRPV